MSAADTKSCPSAEAYFRPSLARTYPTSQVVRTLYCALDEAIRSGPAKDMLDDALTTHGGDNNTGGALKALAELLYVWIPMVCISVYTLHSIDEYWYPPRIPFWWGRQNPTTKSFASILLSE